MRNHGMTASEIEKAEQLGFTDARYAFDACTGRSLSNQSKKGITRAEHAAFEAWLDAKIEEANRDA